MQCPAVSSHARASDEPDPDGSIRVPVQVSVALSFPTAENVPFVPSAFLSSSELGGGDATCARTHNADARAELTGRKNVNAQWTRGESRSPIMFAIVSLGRPSHYRLPNLRIAIIIRRAISAIAKPGLQ
jgi:hypothetical protein